MSVSEKFNKIMDSIETKVRSKEKHSSEIVKEVSRENGISERPLNAVMLFLLNMTTLDYIKSRKLNLSYEYLVKDKKPDINTAIQISGAADQSAFTKKIKKEFGVTPKEAVKNRDRSALKAKVCWENIDQFEVSDSNFSETDDENEENIFGIDQNKYEEINEYIELKYLYQFDELQGKTAYYIYKEYGERLSEAFRFVDQFQYDEYEIDEGKLKEELNLPPDYQFAADSGDFCRLNRKECFEKIVKNCADDPELHYVFFRAEISSIFCAYRAIEKFHNVGVNDVTKVDINAIKICAYTELYAGYCIRAMQYYKDNATDEYGDDAFDEYIEYILENQPYETAFSNITRLKGWDDCEDVVLYDDDFEYNESFEKWAAEETDYSDKYRLCTYDEYE